MKYISLRSCYLILLKIASVVLYYIWIKSQKCIAWDTGLPHLQPHLIPFYPIHLGACWYLWHFVNFSPPIHTLYTGRQTPPSFQLTSRILPQKVSSSLFLVSHSHPLNADILLDNPLSLIWNVYASLFHQTVSYQKIKMVQSIFIFLIQHLPVPGT